MRNKLSGVNISGPIVAAAGFQNGIDINLIIRKFNELQETSVNVITLGSFTMPPNKGNEVTYGPPVYYYDAESAKTYNSMGLANIGVDKAVGLVNKLVPAAHKRSKLVIVSGSPLGSDKYGTSVDQALKLANKLLKTKADLVELNLSCPNVVTSEGGRKPIMGYDLQSVEELLVGLSKNKTQNKVGLKMPPYLSTAEKNLVPKIAKLLKKHPVGFITVCNTIPNQIPTDKKGQPVLSVPGGAGGMSGPATKKTGLEQLKLWKKHLDNRIDIISLLGVDSMDEVKLRLRIGAKAVGGVTFFREKLKLLHDVSITSSQKVILAIDTSNQKEAEKLTKLAAHGGLQLVKFGLELSSAFSWQYCSELAAKYNLEWVADAKLDDIPNTVEKTVINLKNLPYPPFGITIHTTAGVESMRVAQEAAGDIKMLGVTILTSIPDKEASHIFSAQTADKVVQLAEMAKLASLKGIVASSREVGLIKQNPKTKDLFAMIPGSRSVSAERSDQARVDTPSAAIKNGADLLVIGRQISQAKDPVKAYNDLLKEIEGALNG